MSDIGNKQVFAQNLIRFMEAKNVDRYTLCGDLDLKYSTLSEWISARKYPRIDKIEKLANYFGVPKSALIEKTTSEPTVIDPLDEKILELFAQLTPENKEIFLGKLVQTLASQGKK